MALGDGEGRRCVALLSSSTTRIGRAALPAFDAPGIEARAATTKPCDRVLAEDDVLAELVVVGFPLRVVVDARDVGRQDQRERHGAGDSSAPLWAAPWAMATAIVRHC